jgi:hypothetical protein
MGRLSRRNQSRQNTHRDDRIEYRCRRRINGLSLRLTGQIEKVNIDSDSLLRANAVLLVSESFGCAIGSAIVGVQYFDG